MCVLVCVYSHIYTHTEHTNARAQAAAMLSDARERLLKESEEKTRSRVPLAVLPPPPSSPKSVTSPAPVSVAASAPRPLLKSEVVERFRAAREEALSSLDRKDANSTYRRPSDRPHDRGVLLASTAAAARRAGGQSERELREVKGMVRSGSGRYIYVYVYIYIYIYIYVYVYVYVCILPSPHCFVHQMISALAICVGC